MTCHSCPTVAWQGLGKTAQLITYLGCIRHLEKDPGPHLVVVPASLLENWQRELRRWCPALKVVVYYGKHRAVVRKRLNTLRSVQHGVYVQTAVATLRWKCSRACSESCTYLPRVASAVQGEDDQGRGGE